MGWWSWWSTKRVKTMQRAPTSMSPNLVVANKRAVQLFRNTMRSVPRMIVNYELTFSEDQIKARVRELFRKHEGVTDPSVIDMLVYKGQLELEETNMVWKQTPHLMQYFAEPQRNNDTHDEVITNFLKGYHEEKQYS